MCGIAGIISARGPIDRDALSRMQGALHHRGPDGKGEYHENHVGLAHTRLSIIDIEGGAQPLYADGGRLVLIANGEIYNYLELRESLGREGYVFETGSDCETILPLYKKYGKNCVDHLRGMFAFALWDAARNKLLLARDRMGEKPLYLHAQDGMLIFASELQALLASGLVPRTIDPVSIGRYFQFQYVPEPDTPFQSVDKLPAGHCLEVSLDPWRVDKRRYWSMLDAPPLDADPARAIRDAVEDAIKMVLRADVPVGLSLSGGIDSSTIACFAARAYPGTLQAISVGYRAAGDTDERPHAKALAKQLGVEFHDVEIDEDAMVSEFADVVAATDDPIGDISGAGYFAVMRKAHALDLRVMLQGHGIDELLWGYDWVRNALWLNQSGPRRLRDAIRNPAVMRRWIKLARYMRRRHAASNFPLEGERFVFSELMPFNAYAREARASLFPASFRREAGLDEIATWRGETAKTDRVDLEATRRICDSYLLENGIAQGDRLAMAHSVEMRLPFVDHKLVETIIGLRKVRRDDHLPPKHWLKAAVRGIVPDEVLDRRKRGFVPPIRQWEARLRRAYGALLADGFLVQNGILTAPAAAQFAKERIENGVESTVARMALILEIWCRRVVDGSTSAAAALDATAGAHD
ncbi:MAG: asparagine synthase (glutamine-hydrolyzing) [Alphaproteobacteria bacterium]|nr:asparagine synthase (glutamine-hydrolyzing) [Alphaproteobacteria bacterium]